MIIKQTLEEFASQNSLTPGQRDNLIRFNHQFSLDRLVPIRDLDVLKVLKQYALHPRLIDSDFSYLSSLKDDNGYEYSQSLKRVREIDAVVDAFQRRSVPNFRWNENYQKAKLQLERMFSSEHLKSLTYNSDSDVMSYLPKTDTHSGFEYILTGLKKKGEYAKGILQAYNAEEKFALEHGSFGKLILPGTRTQGSGAFDELTGERTYHCKHKTRMINMVDLYVILAELKYAKPIQELLVSNDWYAGGKDPSVITRQFSHWRRTYNYYLSIDYSGYDQTIPDWLIEDAFDIMFKAFDEKGVLCDVIVNDFIHKDLLFDGNIYHLDKGVPSGSMFTQIVDTVCNWLIILTYAYSINEPDIDMMVMGDDNIIFTRRSWNVRSLSEYVSKNFGMIIGSKSDDVAPVSQTPHFLSRYWKYTGQWRHPSVLVSKLAFPERRRRYDLISPDEVIYGYICSYPLGMEELIDVPLFLKQHPNYSYAELAKISSYLPGSVAYNLEYVQKRKENLH